KTSIKTITNLSDTNCLEIHGASLTGNTGHGFTVKTISVRLILSSAVLKQNRYQRYDYRRQG
ncbi:hypothetical protein, partial [Salmonella enterica]|uniref:hypothetical protein n=1 Tax=Salmonella enterica TaxID=28901 RepID=UPI001961E885